MRSFACQLVVVSLLFVSVEGATDIVIDGIPHGEAAAHQQEFGHSLDDHNGDLSDRELDGDHCDHCCHVHAVSITTSAPAILLADLTTRQVPAQSDSIVGLPQAPPTPPPNA